MECESHSNNLNDKKDTHELVVEMTSSKTTGEKKHNSNEILFVTTKTINDKGSRNFDKIDKLQQSYVNSCDTVHSKSSDLNNYDLNGTGLIPMIEDELENSCKLTRLAKIKFNRSNLPLSSSPVI